MHTALVANEMLTGPARIACLLAMGALLVLCLGVLLPIAIREGNRTARAHEAAEAAAPAADPRPATYLPTPGDAPVVTIFDARQGVEWSGVIHDGLVHDASGVIHPDDIGWRFQITRDGADITESLAGFAPRG